MKAYLMKCLNVYRGVNILKLLKTLEPGVKTVIQQKKVINIITKDNVPDALLNDIDYAGKKADTTNDQVDRILEQEQLREGFKTLGIKY